MSTKFRAATASRVLLVAAVAAATLVSLVAPAGAAAAAAPTWSPGVTLAVGSRAWLRATQTPDGRAVLSYEVLTTSRRGRRWILGFRVQDKHGWGPKRVLATLPTSAHRPIFTTASNDHRFVAVFGTPSAAGGVPQLRLREQTLSGKAVLERKLGAGLAPDVAVDASGDVAVVRRLVTRHGESEVGGWAVNPEGHVTPGTLATAWTTGDTPNNFYSPEVVALTKNVFGVGYINYWYSTSDPAQINETADIGITTNEFRQAGGEVFSTNGPENRFTLAAYKGTLLAATDQHPGRRDGLSDVVTSTYVPNSWTPQRSVYTYTGSDPRLETNIVYAPSGAAAAVTNRVYVSRDPEGGWHRGPLLPPHAGRCGDNPSSAFEHNTLDWFIARPAAHDQCAITVFKLG